MARPTYKMPELAAPYDPKNIISGNVYDVIAAQINRSHLEAVKNTVWHMQVNRGKAVIHRMRNRIKN